MRQHLFLSAHSAMSLSLVADLEATIPAIQIAVGKTEDDETTDELIECSSQALFVLTNGSLTHAAFCRDLAHCIDCLELENVIIAFLGPAAGGVEFAMHYAQCPPELKDRGLMGKLAFEWHTGAGFNHVCLHKVAKALLGATRNAMSSDRPPSDEKTNFELPTTQSLESVKQQPTPLHDKAGDAGHGIFGDQDSTDDTGTVRVEVTSNPVGVDMTEDDLDDLDNLPVERDNVPLDVDTAPQGAFEEDLPQSINNIEQ